MFLKSTCIATIIFVSILSITESTKFTNTSISRLGLELLNITKIAFRKCNIIYQWICIVILLIMDIDILNPSKFLGSNYLGIPSSYGCRSDSNCGKDFYCRKTREFYVGVCIKKGRNSLEWLFTNIPWKLYLLILNNHVIVFLKSFRICWRFTHRTTRMLGGQSE